VLLIEELLKGWTEHWQVISAAAGPFGGVLPPRPGRYLLKPMLK